MNTLWVSALKNAMKTSHQKMVCLITRTVYIMVYTKQREFTVPPNTSCSLPFHNILLSLQDETSNHPLKDTDTGVRTHAHRQGEY